MKKTIAIVATMDTKGRESAFVASHVERLGASVCFIDVGVMGSPEVAAEVRREQVARAASADIEALRRAGDRGAAMAAMSRGVLAVVADLLERGKIHGLLGLGGSSGSAIVAAAMQALPIGFPKVLVTTMASGNTKPYVGSRDVTLMHSVVDISGLNRISRKILANAAAAVCGMAAVEHSAVRDRPAVALTMMGVTTPCATVASEALERSGFEVFVFHANGAGGPAMEALVEDGTFAGVLDMTPAEWADELLGGKSAAGPTRMEAAARHGLPQVVSVGGLDMVRFAGRAAIPAHFKTRHFHEHNPTITLMRTTEAESRQLGQIIASKLNMARGPVRVVLPMRGISALDCAGGAFEDEQARRALFGALRASLDPKIACVEMDLHINDPEFGAALAVDLVRLLQAGGRRNEESLNADKGLHS
jgi:uncharacterized protein (UPF0261 family)